MTEENISQLGEEYNKAWQTGLNLKSQLNLIRVLLGMELMKLKSYHEDQRIVDTYGSYNQCLATLQLSRSRSNDMLWNAVYLLEKGVNKKDYPFLDLSIMRYLRKQKINPAGIIDDLRELSYNDIVKKYE